MSKYNTFQNIFIGGQVSRKLHGRFDTKDYNQSLDLMTNMLSTKMGGAFKRTGLMNYYKLDALLDNFAIRDFSSIPFIVNRETSYTIIISDEILPLADPTFDFRIKVIRNEDNPKGIASPATLNPLLSTTPSVRDWGLNLNGTTLAGHWKYAQTGDIIFLCHSSGRQKPIVLARTSETTFDIQYATEFFTSADRLNTIMQRPYKPVNISSTTFTPALGSSDLVASTDYFTSGMVGSYFKLNYVNGLTLETGLVILGDYVSPTVMKIDLVLASVQDGVATDNWSVQAWDDENGWPSSVTAFEQRMYWAGVRTKIYGSLVGNLFHLMSERFEEDKDQTEDKSNLTPRLNYFGELKSTDPFSIVPASTQTNEIRWIAGGKALLIGSLGGEYVANGYQEILSNSSVDIKQHTYHGSSENQVIQAGRDVLYVTRDGRTIRSYRFSDENGSYLSDDLTARADDILWRTSEANLGNNIQIKQMSWQPDKSIVWVVTTSLELYSLTYDPEFGITSWSAHVIGRNNTAGFRPRVLSVSVLPNPTGAFDEVVALVKRDFITGTHLYLEKMIGDFENNTITPPNVGGVIDEVRDYPRYMDSMAILQADVDGNIDVGVEYEGLEITTLSFDGDLASPTMVQSTGIVDALGQLGGYAIGLVVIVGFVYDAMIRTLPLEAGGENGISQGQIKRIDRTTARLYKTERYKVKATNSTQYEEKVFDDVYTGDHRINVSHSPETPGQLDIESSGPYPLNILALIQRGVSYD